MSLAKEAAEKFAMDKEAIGLLGGTAAVGSILGGIKGAFSKKVDPNTGQRQGLIKRTLKGAAKGGLAGLALGGAAKGVSSLVGGGAPGA